MTQKENSTIVKEILPQPEKLETRLSKIEFAIKVGGTREGIKTELKQPH